MQPPLPRAAGCGAGCADQRWSLAKIDREKRRGRSLIFAVGHRIVASAGNTRARCAVHVTSKQEVIMGRGILLWLLGVPIPIIILLFLFFR